MRHKCGQFVRRSQHRLRINFCKQARKAKLFDPQLICLPYRPLLMTQQNHALTQLRRQTSRQIEYMRKSLG